MTRGERLDSLADITMGQAPLGESYNVDGKGIPLIAGAGDFGEQHPVVKKFTTSPGKLCQTGDIVLGIRATIGERVIADRPYCLGRGVAALRPKAGLDSRYLWHWLSIATPTLAAKAKGATFKQVNREDIGGLRLSLPPIHEQRRIAQLLDTADALRAKRRWALAQLDTLAQSIFLDLFGNPATNPKQWPVANLHALGRVTTGSTPPSATEGMFDGAIPFITPGDLESDRPVRRSVTEAGAEESRTVGAGAALVCCIGATIGKMGKATIRSAFNQQINAVEWGSDIDPEYGLAVLRFLKPTVIAWASSTTLPILKKSAFEKIEVPVPAQREQQLFAERIRFLNQIRRVGREGLDTAHALCRALQAQAFQRGV